MTSEGIRGSSDRSILVLTSLASGPKHGYALVRDIENFAGVTLRAGSLYGSLANLEEAGFIRALPAEGRRYPYQITARGLVYLQGRLFESARVAKVGLARIAGARR